MAKKKLKTNDYVALSAFLRAKEARLLSRDQYERMLTEPSFAEACRAAADAGYGDLSELDTEGINAALDARRAAEVEDLRQMLPDPELLRLVSLQYDCHNAKVLVKSEGDEQRAASLWSPAGCYTPDQLREVYAAESGSGELTQQFAEAIREAKLTLARTGNPQIADFLLDKAYFDELLRSAKDTGRRFLTDYVQARIDKVNLRSLLRTLGLPRRGELLSHALIEGGTVGLDQLRDPNLGREDIQKLYAPTIFAARQIVSHRHILVDGKIVNRGGYRLKAGQVISINPKSTTIIEIAKNNDAPVPPYFEKSDDKVTVLHEPLPDEIQNGVEITKVIEYYAR